MSSTQNIVRQLRVATFNELSKRAIDRLWMETLHTPDSKRLVNSGIPTVDKWATWRGVCVLSGPMVPRAVRSLAMGFARQTAADGGRVLFADAAGRSSCAARELLWRASQRALAGRRLNSPPTEYDLRRLSLVAESLADYPVEFTDVQDATLPELRACCQDLTRSRALSLLVLDGLTDVRSDLLADLEDLSSELDIVVVASVSGGTIRGPSTGATWTKGGLPLREGTPELIVAPATSDGRTYSEPSDKCLQLRLDYYTAGQSLRQSVDCMFFAGPGPFIAELSG